MNNYTNKEIISIIEGKEGETIRHIGELNNKNYFEEIGAKLAYIYIVNSKNEVYQATIRKEIEQQDVSSPEELFSLFELDEEDADFLYTLEEAEEELESTDHREYFTELEFSDDIEEETQKEIAKHLYDNENTSRSIKVMTDEAADEAAAEYIKDSLWAFNASFISCHTKNGLNDRAEKALEKMQGELCEDANAIIEALIEDIDIFIEDAIRADGRGHFLSLYDGKENEIEINGITYFYYLD